MKGPVEPVHRSVPETIQEVMELTGFLCFLFRSTPMSNMLLLLLESMTVRMCPWCACSPYTCRGCELIVCLLVWCLQVCKTWWEASVTSLTALSRVWVRTGKEGKLHRLSQTATKGPRLSQTDIDGQGLPKTAKDCHRLSQTATDGQRLPHTATECQRRPQTATECHRLPHTATDCHRLPQTAKDCHRLP